MRFLPLYLNKTSMRLLILLMAVHIIGTIVAYAIYAKLSSLGDGYLPKDYLQAVELKSMEKGLVDRVWCMQFIIILVIFCPGFGHHLPLVKL